MNATLDLYIPSRASAFEDSLSLEQVRERAPAVFAPAAHARTSQKYTFIQTERVLVGLMGARFAPVEARHAHTPGSRACITPATCFVCVAGMKTVQLRDAVPEIVFLNSHDGTSAYELRTGIFPVVCTNELIVSRGAFPGVCVAHRGDIVDEVVTGALRISEQFENLTGQVERMEARQQLEFAHTGDGGALSGYGGSQDATGEPSVLPSGRGLA
jgi:hypothetical protein